MEITGWAEWIPKSEDESSRISSVPDWFPGMGGLWTGRRLGVTAAEAARLEGRRRRSIRNKNKFEVPDEIWMMATAKCRNCVLRTVLGKWAQKSPKIF